MCELKIGRCVGYAALLVALFSLSLLTAAGVERRTSQKDAPAQAAAQTEKENSSESRRKPQQSAAIQKFSDVELRDIYGYSHTLADFFAEPAEAVVVFFSDPDCPVVRQYLPRLKELYAHYNGFERDRLGLPVKIDAQGRETVYRYPGERVVLLAVYSMPEFDVKRMAAHALDERLPFRPLLDSRQQALSALGAEKLSEVVLLDRQGEIRYQGAIDDQFFRGGAKHAAQEHYLRDAINAVLAGEEVPRPRRPAQGCEITRLSQHEAPSAATFHAQIEPILQRRCQECHRPGMVGPMPLLTYEDVSRYGAMVAEVVHDRRMPPWPAESPRAFKDDIRLSEDERQTILAWCRAGMPRGNPADAPPPREWPPASEWKIGKPDFVFEMPEPYAVPATGALDYVYFPIQVNLPEERTIQAIETVPGDPSVVHHIQVHEYRAKINPQQRVNLTALEQLFLYGPAIEGAKLIGNYSPGSSDNARVFAEGRGVKLARGANLLFELHYTPNGRATQDRSKVGIKFADTPPRKEVKTHFFFRKRGDFVIPANVPHHSMQHLYHFEKPVRILGIRPHLHYRGKHYRLELVTSREVGLKEISDMRQHDLQRGETLLTIPVWDFNWQLTYEFKEPLIIQRGEALLATGYWDNSRFNPRNPNHEQDVPWGLQTEQEMFHTMFLYEELDDDDPRVLPRSDSDDLAQTLD